MLYRLRRQLRRRWPSALGSALVLALVGGVALTLLAGTVRTLSAPDRYSASRGKVFDATIEQSAGAPRAEEVRSLPAVATVETATFVFGGLVGPGGDLLEALVFAGSHRGFGLGLTEGREADPSKPDEFVATKSFLRVAGAELGDRFEVISISQAQADERGFDVDEPAGASWTGTLVGVIGGPSEIEDPTPIVLFPAAALDLGDVGVAATVGAVGLEPGSSLAELRAQLDALPGGSAFGIDAAEWVSATVRSAVSTQGQGLAVLAVVVTIASVAVLGQLLSRQVRPSEQERLALRALGLTRPQAVVDGVSQAAAPVVLGVVGALALALGASGIFPVGFVRQTEPHLGLRFEPFVHGLGPPLLALLLLGWTALALLVDGRPAPETSRVGAVERVASRVRPASAATGIRFAFSRPSGQPNPARASLVGLVLVLGVLVGTLVFGDNLDRLLDEPARYGTNFDAGVGAGGDEVPEQVVSLLEADPDVAGLTFYGTVLTSVGARSLDVTGMDPVRGDLRPVVLAGRLPVADDEIVLGRVAARDNDVGLGDDLTVTGATGPQVFRVTGLAVVTSLDGGDGLGQGGMTTLDGLRRIDPSAPMRTLAVRLEPGSPANALERISEEIDTAIGPPEPPGIIVNLARVRSIPYVVAGALATLALLSLAHQLIVSAVRRRRDVAVLRAMGADRRWVTGVVHWQASVFAVVVLALALPVGGIAGRVVFRIFVDRIGAPNDVGFPFLLFGTTLLGLVVLANLAASLPARRTRLLRPAVLLAGD